MNSTLSYVKDDLKLFLYQVVIKEEVAKEKISIPEILNHYRMTFVLKGHGVAQYNDNKIEISEGQMIFADIGTLFCCNFLNKEEVAFLDVIIFSSVLNEKSEDKFFLRGLQNMPIRDRVIRFDMGENPCIKSAVDGVVKCLENHLGRPHILPRLKSIISDIDMIYDERYSNETKTTDSIPVEILKYIRHHYHENITDEFICEKFFVSKPTLRKIFRMNTGKTMHEFIEKLRMESADSLLKAGYDTTQVSVMCGYSYYTTFLKAYKRHFNELPHENKSKKSRGYPLPSSKNK